MVDLGTLGGSASSADAINASGQLTGFSNTTGDIANHAFLYGGVPGSGGHMADLGTLGGSESFGSGISASGQIVGISNLSGNATAHAFLYSGVPGSGGNMTDLGTLGGSGSSAIAINASDQIAGDGNTTGDAADHAFLYCGVPGSNGHMSDLGTLGGTNSSGIAINSSGQITGMSLITGGASFHAFLYSGTPGANGHMADLGTLGGTLSKGLAINANGQIVGWSRYGVTVDQHAFFYNGTPGSGGQMIDLDAWLDANNPTEGAKWTLAIAYGLTDNGLITGTGSYDDGPGGLSDGTRAFLLDASALVVPEPSTFILAALGMFSLIALRRRHSLYSSAFRGKQLRAGLTICTTSFIVAALAAAAHAELPTTILHNFAGGTNDGYGPTALTISGTRIYGITQEGGVADFGPAGVAYSLDITNNAFALLHSFAGGASDGATPTGNLTLAGSMLFGTTYQGGSSNWGTIYSLNTTNNGLTILHFFPGGASDGIHPSAGLTASGTTLYGVTESGPGALFSLNTNTNVISILHSFKGGVSDGAIPETKVILSGSTLYGTASAGGAFNHGVLFSLDTATNALTVLHSFDANSHAGRAGLTLSGTKLYGTTPDGGSFGSGTVFSFDTAGDEFTVLHSFAGGPSDGRDPEAGLTLSGSMLYGTTQSGGALSPGGMQSHGTVFSLDTSGNNYTLLHSFAGGLDDGALPTADLILSGSTLYGTTFSGGTAGDGTVFAIQIPEPSSLALIVLGLLSVGVATLRRGPSRGGLLFNFAVVFAHLAVREATAAYTFTSIADSSTAGPTGNPLLSFRDAAVSGNNVAFGATFLANASIGNADGIFRGSGGPLAVIAKTLVSAPPIGILDKAGRPSISGDSVVFWGHYSSTFPVRAGEAVYFGTGSGLSTTVKTGDQHMLVLANPLQIGTSLVFLGSPSVYVPDSIYTYLGGTFTRIVGAGDSAPPGGTFSGIDLAYASSDGIEAFRARYGGSAGIFTTSGGAITTIAKTGDIAPSGGTFSDVSTPSISGNTVAFLGTASSASGIFIGSGGSLTTIAKMGDSTPGGGTFETLSRPAIGGSTVAFQASASSGEGIYAASGGLLNAVIETGQPLFGSTVTSLDFESLGLDAGGSGNLAFIYGLANGATGVALATPTPPSLIGDYNGNGTVDAADYVVWRNGLGTTYSQNDYDVWRSHFGQPSGSAAGATADAAVPEPATLVLLVTGMLAMCARWRTTGSKTR